MNSFDQESKITNLEYFVIFDENISKKEGSEPVIFYSFFLDEIQNHSYKNEASSSSKNEHRKNPFFLLNQVGIFLTYIQFSKHFTQNIPCNYARTDCHETALLELGNKVWMAAHRKTSSTDSSNKELLQSMLRSCRNIYNMFFTQPKRNPTTNEVTPHSIKMLKGGFEMIVKSMAFADLSFIHLFDSFFQLELEKKIEESIDYVYRTLRQKIPITNIAIMYSRYFIYSTFPIDIARTLSICLRMKFPYLFPRVLAKDDENLYWVIGLSKTERNTISLYTPPLFIEGKEYPFIVLREKKIRFLFTLDNSVCPSFSLLNKIPSNLKELRGILKFIKFEMKEGNKRGPYIVLKNQINQKSLLLAHENLVDSFIPIAEKAIFQSHLFVSNSGFLQKIVYPINPQGMGYYIYFERNENNEFVVICLNDKKEATQALQNSYELLDPQNIKRHQLIYKK